MDRIPPFDESAEKAIIGACLTTPVESIADAGAVITTPEFFYDARCRAAWALLSVMVPHDVNCITLAGAMAPAMPRALADAFLSECQDHCVSSANLPVWLEVVQDKFTLRRIIRTATEAVGAAYESKDVNATLDAFESDALKIRPQRHNERDMRSLVNEAVAAIEFRAQNWEAITGLSTGLSDLDKLTDGLHPGEFIIPAALPSCGKTALSVGIAIYNALQGIPVGIISGEMRPVQLVIRALCSESRVNFKRISESDCTKIIPQIGKLSAAPIYIQQANGYTIGQVQACARRWQQKHGIKLLVGDYIQRFQGHGANRELEIASIGAGFKNLALELGIPVIAPSQLNEDGKLRESRALGHDADSVWMLANDGEWKSDVQPVKLRVEKCRDGETGEVALTFFKHFTRFELAPKIEREYQSPTND